MPIVGRTRKASDGSYQGRGCLIRGLVCHCLTLYGCIGVSVFGGSRVSQRQKVGSGRRLRAPLSAALAMVIGACAQMGTMDATGAAPGRNEAGILIGRRGDAPPHALGYPVGNGAMRGTPLPPMLHEPGILESRHFPGRGEWAAIIRARVIEGPCADGRIIQVLVMSSGNGFGYGMPQNCSDRHELGIDQAAGRFTMSVNGGPFQRITMPRPYPGQLPQFLTSPGQPERTLNPRGFQGQRNEAPRIQAATPAQAPAPAARSQTTNPPSPSQAIAPAAARSGRQSETLFEPAPVPVPTEAPREQPRFSIRP